MSRPEHPGTPGPVAERSRELLEAILDNTTAVVYVKDRDGRYILINHRYEQLFHVTLAEVIGRTDHDLFPAEAADAFRKNDLEILAGRRPVKFEEVAPHDDGPHTYVSVKFPILDRDGEPYAVAGISTDITERKRAEDEARERNRQLEELARSEREAVESLRRTQSQLVQAEKLAVLGQTVAGVAHEINNPLAFVANNAAVLERNLAGLEAAIELYRQADGLIERERPDLIARIREHDRRLDLGRLAAEARELLGQSGEGLRRIQQVVDDLRSLVRLDRGGLQEANLVPGLVSTVNIVRGRAGAAGVEIDVDLGTLPRVLCYPAKLHQVVLNLLVNAIDACRRGGRVHLRARPEPDGVRIEVEDDGLGIEEGLQQQIFEPFFTTKPAGQGTGLGLSISRSIVEEHGGRIEVRSRPGEGSRFAVRIPLRPAAGAPGGQPE